VRMLKISIWHNSVEHDWSVRVNGVLHSHVSNQMVDDLVEHAFVAVEQSEFMEAESSDISDDVVI
jgi:hypothetical protein